jgi:hypothetical protein
MSSLAAPQKATIRPDTANIGPEHADHAVKDALRPPIETAEAVVKGVARLDQARCKQEQQKQRRAEKLECVGKAQPPQRRYDVRRPRERVRHEMGADHHQRSAAYEQRKDGLGPEPADDEARAEARHDEAHRAPRPHFAVVESASPDAGHRHGLDQRQDRGPVRSKEQARKQHLPEPVRHPEQKERAEGAPSERDQDGPAPSCAVGGEADGRREHDAGEGRRGEKQRNLVGVEVAPVQPDRQIGKVAATDQEDSGVKEAEPPGAGRRCGARFNLLGQIL